MATWIYPPSDIFRTSGGTGPKIMPFCCYIRSVNLPCMTDVGEDRIRLESWSSCKFCCYACYDIRPQSCSISRQVSLPWGEDSQNFSATSAAAHTGCQACTGHPTWSPRAGVTYVATCTDQMEASLRHLKPIPRQMRHHARCKGSWEFEPGFLHWGWEVTVHSPQLCFPPRTFIQQEDVFPILDVNLQPSKAVGNLSSRVRQTRIHTPGPPVTLWETVPLFLSICASASISVKHTWYFVPQRSVTSIYVKPWV